MIFNFKNKLKLIYLIRNKSRCAKHHFRQPQSLDISVFPPKREKPILDNPILGKPEQGEPILLKPHQLNTDLSRTNLLTPDLLNTELSNTNQSNPYPINHEQQKPMGYDEIGCDNAQEVKELVLENLEYECIRERYKDERLDEIVDLMVETLCSTKPTINIVGDEYPAQLVKEKLLGIDSMHIEYVFHCLDKNTTYIRNIRRYLLATLFNAPSTIDHYYSALVNHDFGGRP